MKTSQLYTKGTWNEVLNDCRNTVSKKPIAKEPSPEFKKSILIAEHSPIRDIIFRWKWLSIPYWVSVHWVRHKWECFVSTQRTDRTGVKRDSKSQDAPVDFQGEANTQALIDTMRKRLCYQAAKETREYAENLKEAIHDIEPEIADVLVPNCVYRAGCPELGTCGLWDRLKYWAVGKHDLDISTLSIRERYELYNEFFKEYTHDT